MQHPSVELLQGLLTKLAAYHVQSKAPASMDPECSSSFASFVRIDYNVGIEFTWITKPGHNTHHSAKKSTQHSPSSHN